MTLVNNSSTTSKRSLWPDQHHNAWTIDAKDARLRVLENGKSQWFDDWASALGAVTLGYGISTRMTQASSLPHLDEQALANEFCEAMHCEAVRFLKSGSDAMACAVRLARAQTKRDTIIVFDKSYHGVSSDFGGLLWTAKGIVKSGTLVIRPFGEELPPDARLNKVAAIVVEPVPKCIDVPPDGWLQHLREMATHHGCLLITDEVVLGYRHTLQGYGFNYSPDIRCYGKAMAQGTALAAVCGPAKIMNLLAKEVHYSGTNNGEPGHLALARTVLARYKREGICGTLRQKGQALRLLLEAIGLRTRGLDQRFQVEFDTEDQRKDAINWCWDHNILWPGWVSMQIMHTPAQMLRLTEVLSEWKKAKL